MPQLPVTSIPSNIDTLSESLECAGHIIGRMLVTSQTIPSVQEKRALTADFEQKVYELVSQDHFLPFQERTNFFERMPTEVFENNMLDTVNALQTGHIDVVWEHIVKEYDAYVRERSAYWILHAACAQHYNKDQLEQLLPLDVSHFSDNNWQQLIYTALENDGIDAVIFLNELTNQLNLTHALVAALNVEAHACMDYIVPRVDIQNGNLAHVLTISGYSKNQKVFEYFCSKVVPNEHISVRTQLDTKTASNANILEWFDAVTIQQQRQRLLNEVDSPKHLVARKM